MCWKESQLLRSIILPLIFSSKLTCQFNPIVEDQETTSSVLYLLAYQVGLDLRLEMSFFVWLVRSRHVKLQSGFDGKEYPTGVPKIEFVLDWRRANKKEFSCRSNRFGWMKHAYVPRVDIYGYNRLNTYDDQTFVVNVKSPLYWIKSNGSGQRGIYEIYLLDSQREKDKKTRIQRPQYFILFGWPSHGQFHQNSGQVTIVCTCQLIHSICPHISGFSYKSLINKRSSDRPVIQ